MEILRKNSNLSKTQCSQTCASASLSGSTDHYLETIYFTEKFLGLAMSQGVWRDFSSQFEVKSWVTTFKELWGLRHKCNPWDHVDLNLASVQRTFITAHTIVQHFVVGTKQAHNEFHRKMEDTGTLLGRSLSFLSFWVLCEECFVFPRKLGWWGQYSLNFPHFVMGMSAQSLDNSIILFP